LIKSGQKYLAAKKAEAGVVSLGSGLMYKELIAGTGKTPTVSSPCSCHYSGTLIDGTEFDSSYKRGEVGQINVVFLMLAFRVSTDSHAFFLHNLLTPKYPKYSLSLLPPTKSSRVGLKQCS
jgi:hypothetical protein